MVQRNRRVSAGDDDPWRSVAGLRAEYEWLFADVIARAMQAKSLPEKDPAIAAKLALGTLNWVSMWFRPEHVGAAAGVLPVG
jgi:hypothetical protein